MGILPRTRTPSYTHGGLKPGAALVGAWLRLSARGYHRMEHTATAPRPLPALPPFVFVRLTAHWAGRACRAAFVAAPASPLPPPTPPPSRPKQRPGGQEHPSTLLQQNKKERCYSLACLPVLTVHSSIPVPPLIRQPASNYPTPLSLPHHTVLPVCVTARTLVLYVYL